VEAEVSMKRLLLGPGSPSGTREAKPTFATPGAAARRSCSSRRRCLASAKFATTESGSDTVSVCVRLCAALTAYLSVRFLMRYFETNRLTPFALYCFVAGLLLSVYFFVT